MFSKALVRTPCASMINGITSADLGAPNYNIALAQHKLYISALESCGLDITALQPDEAFPDGTFVEDTALVTPHAAIITNPGADSRKGETITIRKTLEGFYQQVETITDPGTIDAGDIMMVGSHFYIGLSERTNECGAEQMISILERYSMSGSMVPMKDVLHLKTGLSYLENNKLIISEEFVNEPQFEAFEHLVVPREENYAANSLWINGKVLVPAGFPKTLAMIETAGYKTIAVDVSEFQKIDGGLSCLSLRF